MRRVLLYVLQIFRLPARGFNFLEERLEPVTDVEREPLSLKRLSERGESRLVAEAALRARYLAETGGAQ